MFVRVCVWVFSHTNIGIFNFVSNGCTLSVPLHLYLYLFGSRICPSNRVEISVVALSVAKAKLQAQSCKGLVPVVLPTSLVAPSHPLVAARLFCSLTAALPPFGSHSALSLSLCTRSPILPLSRDTFVHCALPCRPATPRLNWELINRAIPFDWRCLSSIESCVDVPLHWISANNRAGDYVTVFTRLSLSLSLSAEFALSGTCSAHSRVYFMDHNSVVPPDIYTIYILAPDLPPMPRRNKRNNDEHRIATCLRVDTN